ncbi:ABC transporter substrate-binding protein [Nitrospirillum sp. BR 11164]|uniref:ABC transporter substrate-binding protein n=1 Tax=Nitrospirillum sp. BR 11164 TaxID=3104324 RepID=UPI002AFF0A38|nr:ABC transporter substrate-binding protein [Nitrospirillum sp. BR 11164]MEA1648041.1 ABC transporter substrate-binding protein [Nitrospirillum sp. BR 11164]
MRRFKAVALALVLTVLAGHGGAAELAPLRVGDQRGAVQVLLKAAGELEHVPYRIDWALFPVGAPLVEALNADAIDFGYVGDATTTFALAAGARLKTINVWDFGQGGAAIVVPDKAPIHTVADLRGRRVGLVRGSPGHLLVVAALKQAGVPLADVTLVYLSAADAKAALGGGSIDAWAIWDPYVAAAQLQDHMRILVGSQGTVREVECGVASDGAIAAKRAQLIDFIARVRRAYQWVRAHRQEQAEAYARDTGTPLDVAVLTFSRQQVTVLPAVTDEAIAVHQAVADLYFEAGVIPTRVDVAPTYDRSFVLQP